MPGEMTGRDGGTPRSRWVTGAAAALLVVAVSPLLTLRVTSADTELVRSIALVDTVLHTVTLTIVVLLHVHWRRRSPQEPRWLVAALAAVAVKGIAASAIRLAAPDSVTARRGDHLALDVAFAGLMLALVLAQTRGTTRHRVDAVLVGASLGLVVPGAKLALLDLGLPLGPGPAWATAGAVALALLHGVFAWAVLTRGLDLPWTRALPVALAVVGVGYAAPLVLDEAWRDTGPMVDDALATALLTVTALVVLHATLRDAVVAADERVLAVEGDVRAERERLHEINATIAGIATATRLLHDRPDMDPAHRRTLADMLGAEIARLERLVAGRPSAPEEVAVDEVVQRVVVAQRAMGRDVQWTAAGLTSSVSADDLTEVLVTLLENAARHAPGSSVSITSRRAGGTIEIAVADTGPGITPEAAERIFDWGEHGRGSAGQGIGLAVAKRLVTDLGGSLLVVPAQRGSGRGATFVISLPTTRRTHEPAGPAHAAAP